MRIAGYLLTVLVACMAPLVARSDPLRGVVQDGDTGEPLPAGTVTAAGRTWPVDARGEFAIDAQVDVVQARAPGYRAERRAIGQGEDDIVLSLTPFRPHAVYLSIQGVTHAAIRAAALDLQEKGVINALVIDVKGDRGQMLYDSAARTNAGAAMRAPRAPVMPDLAQRLDEWHHKGLYLIARMVVFKDDPLAAAHPEWAVRSNGGVWRDNEQMQWIDPSNRQARDHYLDLIEEVARLGFDEVQLDYVRFPDASGLAFGEPNTRANRIDAIVSFLRDARDRLRPYNTFLAADIFGYVCWNRNDTGIGQQIETLGDVVDYISPMLYPSGFTWGIEGLKTPTDDAGQIVRRSLAEARARTGLPGVRFRPWLQAFRDYAFDRRAFGNDEILAQAKAADSQDSDGWMLWNSRNQYGALIPLAPDDAGSTDSP